MSNHTPQLNSAEFLSAVLRVIHYKKYIYFSENSDQEEYLTPPNQKQKTPH